MSVDSLLTNLKNKVTYNLHQAVNDPDANEFASNQPEPLSPATTEKVEEDTGYFEISSTDDPNTFNPKRLLRRIGNQIIRMIKNGFFPFIALVLSMYVTNEMIVYSAPIRLIFFIFTFWVCKNFMPFLIILLIYYLCKLGYQYFLNNLSNGPKTKVMPTIFALLPLTTTVPVSSLGAFFMYPFTYPKNDYDAKQLPIIMNDYMESLKKAFVYFDKIQTLPFVVEGFKQLEENVKHLHDIPETEPETKPETEPESESKPKSSAGSLPPTIKSSTPPQNNKGNASLPATVVPPPSYNNNQNTSLPATVESSNTPQNNKGNASLPPTVESSTPPQNNKGNTSLPATVKSSNTPQNNKGNASLPPTVESSTPPQNNKGNASLPATVKSSNAPPQNNNNPNASLPATVKSSNAPQNNKGDTSLPATVIPPPAYHSKINGSK